MLEDGLKTYHGLAANGTNSYRSENIGGSVGYDWLKDNEWTGADIDRQGRATGVQDGDLKGVGATHFDTDATSNLGDSGGPHYRKVGGDTVDIAGTHMGTPSGTTDSRATIMDKIEARWDISVA